MLASRLKKRAVCSLLVLLTFFSTVAICLSAFSGKASALGSSYDAEPIANEILPNEDHLDIVASNIYYGDYLHIYYAVKMDLPDGLSADKVKMAFWKKPQTSYTLESDEIAYIASIDGKDNTLGNEVKINGEVAYTDCAIFRSLPIAAKEMGDAIYARAYVIADNGDVFYSNVTKYSVLEYVHSRYAEKENGGAVTDAQMMLYDKMLQYGASAQIVFRYKTDLLVTSEAAKISIVNGTTSDGFCGGYYIVGDTVTMTADKQFDQTFKAWTDSKGNIVSESPVFDLKITEDTKGETYTAVYGDYVPTAEVLPVKGGAGGIVCIVHDDGNIDTVYNLEEIFYKHGIVGNLALMSEHSKTTSNLTKWKEIISTGRWKVMSHSATHTWWGTATDNGDGTYTFADNWPKVENEIVTSQAKLREMFPGQRVLAFAYPGFASEKNTYVGAYAPAMGTDKYNKILEFIYSPDSRELIADTYVVARYDSILTGNEAYVDNVRDFYYMNGGFISTSNYNSGNILARLEDAANGGFHLFSLHTCTENGEITPAAMDSVCRMLAEYVKEGKIWNTFYEDAALYVKEAQNSSLAISGDKTAIKVNLTDTLDDEIYNYALTVRVRVPDSWEACKIVQGDNVSYAVVKTADGLNLIDADIVPDGGEATITPVSLSDVPKTEEKAPALPIGPDGPFDPNAPEEDPEYEPNTNLALDKYIDFETDPGIVANGAGSVAFGDRDGGKTIKMVDANTSSMGHWTVPFGNATGVERFKFTFDINVASASSGFNTTFYFADAPNSPYMMTLIPSSSGYTLGDCQSNSGGAGTRNDNLTGSLSFNTWYTVMIDVTINGANGFKATWYVKDSSGVFQKTGESTNFCNINRAADATPGTTISYFKASSLGGATAEMYFDNMIMQAGTAAQFNATIPAIDKLYTFDNGTEGATSSGSATYTSEAPTAGASNALCVSKAAGYKTLSFNAGTTVQNAASFVVEFDVNMTSDYTSTLLQMVFNSALASTPYDITFVGGKTGYTIGDLSNASGGTGTTITNTALEYGKTYHIKVEVALGDSADTFLATFYVDGVEVGTSSNYYKVNGSTNPPQTAVNGITFHWQNAATFKLYIDNLSLKVYEAVEVEETPEEEEEDIGFGTKLENGHVLDKNFFPGFVRKTLSFTLDDGLNQYDKKVVDILKPQGFTGTFCINDPATVTDPSLYDGFEVANHHILHTTGYRSNFDYDSYIVNEKWSTGDKDPSKIYILEKVIDGKVVPGFYYVHYSIYGSTAGWHPLASDETYIEYLELTTKKLEAIFGEDSVVGFAYPHGNVPPAVKEYLENNPNYLYARKTGIASSFNMPTDRFAWTYNADHSNLLEKMASFEALEDDGALKMFSFGIHAKDYETASKWDVLKTYAMVYGNRSDEFWYATNRQIFEYEDALNALVVSDEKIVNDSDIDVYVKVDGEEVVIKANSEYLFK